MAERRWNKKCHDLHNNKTFLLLIINFIKNIFIIYIYILCIYKESRQGTDSDAHAFSSSSSSTTFVAKSPPTFIKTAMRAKPTAYMYVP